MDAVGGATGGTGVSGFAAVPQSGAPVQGVEGVTRDAKLGGERPGQSHSGPGATFETGFYAPLRSSIDELEYLLRRRAMEQMEAALWRQAPVYSAVSLVESTDASAPPVSPPSACPMGVSAAASLGGSAMGSGGSSGGGASGGGGAGGGGGTGVA
jgi:hypothetical protein